MEVHYIWHAFIGAILFQFFLSATIINPLIAGNLWRIKSSPPSAAYMSVNRVSIGSDNGLLPIQRQAII